MAEKPRKKAYNPYRIDWEGEDIQTIKMLYDQQPVYADNLGHTGELSAICFALSKTTARYYSKHHVLTKLIALRKAGSLKKKGRKKGVVPNSWE